jgi:predicted DNA-binding transcriptional regulator YafY
MPTAPVPTFKVYRNFPSGLTAISIFDEPVGLSEDCSRKRRKRAAAAPQHTSISEPRAAKAEGQCDSASGRRALSCAATSANSSIKLCERMPVPRRFRDPAEEEQLFRPAIGLLRRAGAVGSSSLEAIRFAAANRLCIDLHYQGSVRRIEPYSLRRTRAGAILLFAVRTQNGESRSYRLDRIEGTVITDETFTPKFAIELATRREWPFIAAAGDLFSVVEPQEESKETRRAIGEFLVSQAYVRLPGRLIRFRPLSWPGSGCL